MDAEEVRQLRMGLGWVILIRGDTGSYSIIGWIVSYHRLDRIVSLSGSYHISWIGSYHIGWIGSYHIGWIVSGNTGFTRWLATGWMGRMDWMGCWWDGGGTDRR